MPPPWPPLMQMLRNAITPRTRMILLCNPSNPTGAVYPLEAQTRVRGRPWDLLLPHQSPPHPWQLLFLAWGGLSQIRDCSPCVSSYHTVSHTASSSILSCLYECFPGSMMAQ